MGPSGHNGHNGHNGHCNCNCTGGQYVSHQPMEDPGNLPGVNVTPERAPPVNRFSSSPPVVNGRPHSSPGALQVTNGMPSSSPWV